MTPGEPNEAVATTIAVIKDFFMLFLAKKSAASCSLGFEIGNFMLANAQAYESGRGLDVQKRQRVMRDNSARVETIVVHPFIGREGRIKC
jgi:hypothetical protein